MRIKPEDFFKEDIPENILNILNEILGKTFDEGQFYDIDELVFENNSFREYSDIKSGICITRSGGADYLFIENLNDTYNLYSLINGDQDNREDYTLVFEISNQETSETFINKVNNFYEKRYAEFELDEDFKKTTTLKFISELPNGIKDLLTIKKQFELSNSISELKMKYTESRKIEIDCYLVKGQQILKDLPTEIRETIEIN
ncbi:hypothetical protein [Algibacter lectus]|uniref:hypothetical protein n=1 Tax=Algibacter lectus TaxID=221126 RepID=UPI0026ED2426|nr:hypothetical protein [Algibacter lectus]MDO7138121.1 hypothetical protein [Algibacter lectus]